ncbi:WAT1-related protein [Arachis hypogaea]|uniref:WAT1-related protein n=1 Tax=Arachis hypogaea TaxID=3818 RepID=A0A6B9VDH7_ARAHY|nr:WAT1-related protein [Arachis hypogaea]
MVLAQVGYAFLYFITETSFNHGMSPFLYVTYRHIVAAVIMFPFAFFLERFNEACNMMGVDPFRWKKNWMLSIALAQALSLSRLRSLYCLRYPTQARRLSLCRHSSPSRISRAHAPFLPSSSSTAEAAGPGTGRRRRSLSRHRLTLNPAPLLPLLCSSPRRQKQQVLGLIFVVVFLLRLSPSASFAQPEAGLQFACAFESNEKICQQNLPAKVKVAKAPKRLKIPHVHCCNKGKQL